MLVSPPLPLLSDAMINCHDAIKATINIRIMATPPGTLKLPLPIPFSDLSSPRSPLEFQKSAVTFAAVATTTAIAVQDASPKKETQKRVVHFDKTVHYTEIRHIRDFSQDEVEAIWMTMRDYQIIKAMVKSTVIMMMKGEPIPEEDLDLCTRGLEFRTKVGSKIRLRNKLRARFAVLNEQDLQRDEGFCDPSYIAMACLEVSLDCRQGARARALYDEKVIQCYLADVRNGVSGTESVFDDQTQVSLHSQAPTCSKEQVLSARPADLSQVKGTELSSCSKQQVLPARPIGLAILAASFK
jgi:hypothetical protein